MKILKTILLLVVLMGFVGCKKGKKEAKKTAEEIEETIEEAKNEVEEEIVVKKIEIKLESKSKSTVKGTVVFTESDGIVSMAANLTGLSEGEHAIHLHEKSDCTSADGKSTGGHWNPTLKPHGKWGAKKGFHKGDIGNFKADTNGNGNITFATNEWCIGCGNDKKDILGKAVIVHQGTDDFTSQPSGAAGSRVSCGAVIQ